jgi:hypothetical protein
VSLDLNYPFFDSFLCFVLFSSSFTDQPGASSLSAFVTEYDRAHDPTWQAVKANERRAEKAEKEAAKMAAGEIESCSAFDQISDRSNIIDSGCIILSSRKYIHIIFGHANAMFTTFRAAELNRQKNRAAPRASTSQLKGNRRSNLKWRRCPKVGLPVTAPCSALPTFLPLAFTVQCYGGTTGGVFALRYRCQN